MAAAKYSGYSVLTSYPPETWPHVVFHFNHHLYSVLHLSPFFMCTSPPLQKPESLGYDLYGGTKYSEWRCSPSLQAFAQSAQNVGHLCRVAAFHPRTESICFPYSRDPNLRYLWPLCHFPSAVMLDCKIKLAAAPWIPYIPLNFL